MADNLVKVCKYIVIQKQNYRKLHKFNKPNSSVTVGRDSINLTGIEGCPYFSVFRMVSSSKKGREYTLELTEEAVELKDEIDIRTSGTDNRNIVDDGRSQKLTYSEIEELAIDASKASDIVETLISNSKTFHNKTEYSQEKYLKKKEKKYFEFIQILRPNLRMIAEVMYKLEPGKIQNLRIDTLSQMITLSNIHCEGTHLLYDSGSNGLIAAALLSAIGANTNGKLIHMHPGNMSQKQALLAMNFSEEQLNRCISVNIYSALRQYYQGTDNHVKTTESSDSNHKSSLENTTENVEENSLKRKIDDDDKVDETSSKIPKLENSEEPTDKAETEQNNETSRPETNKQPTKKPKWHFDNINAAEELKEKMDSLIIASKEDPQNIFLELVQFVKPGRPFVIYFSVAEPLQNLYTVLKSHAKVAALKLTCNWMRNYQVLPERTHPEVMMNAQSGFLLTGYVLK